MVDVAFGSIFLFAGLAACAIAGILRRSGARIFIWLGLWSALYGLSQLTLAPSFTSVLPAWLQSNASDVRSAVTYVAIFPAAVAFRELSLGNLRLLMQGFLLARRQLDSLPSSSSQPPVRPRR